MSETTVTVDQARALLSAPGYDAYGVTRLYGVWSIPLVYAGQIAAVKSVQQLETGYFERLYTVSRTTVPVHRAGRGAR